MKASTLFALVLAILLGLGAVAGAKYTGLFNSSPPATEAPPVEPPRILVAGHNLFEGITLTRNDVILRPLRPEEMAHFQANRDQYLPPMPQAAELRTLLRNVTADQPLLKEHLQDQAIPPGLNQRLEPGMRAVNVATPKERAAGGLIQLGERVDVYLTCDITHGIDPSARLTKTACVAKDLKVIIKRNSLWTVMAPVPDDQPVHFTLQANPYRAALVEFAQTQGTLSLVPTPAPQERNFDASKAAGSRSYSDPDSKEYRDEDQRVASLLKGELTVGEADLERIFNLKAPPGNGKKPTVEMYVGIHMKGRKDFPTENVHLTDTGTGGQPAMGYAFGSPAEGKATKK